MFKTSYLSFYLIKYRLVYLLRKSHHCDDAICHFLFDFLHVLCVRAKKVCTNFVQTFYSVIA